MGVQCSVFGKNMKMHIKLLIYKQMPTAQNYIITRKQLEDIPIRCNPINTVYQALESHRQDKNSAHSVGERWEEHTR